MHESAQFKPVVYAYASLQLPIFAMITFLTMMAVCFFICSCFYSSTLGSSFGEKPVIFVCLVVHVGIVLVTEWLLCIAVAGVIGSRQNQSSRNACVSCRSISKDEHNTAKKTHTTHIKVPPRVSGVAPISYSFHIK